MGFDARSRHVAPEEREHGPRGDGRPSGGGLGWCLDELFSAHFGSAGNVRLGRLLIQLSLAQLLELLL
jgi:hypothetical protein